MTATRSRVASALLRHLRVAAVAAAATTLTCAGKPRPAVFAVPGPPTRPPATLTASAATDALLSILGALPQGELVNLGDVLTAHVSEVPEPCRGKGQVMLVDLADGLEEDVRPAIGPALVLLLSPTDYDPCTGGGYPVMCSVAMVEVDGKYRLAVAEIEHGAADRVDVDAGVFTRGRSSGGTHCQFLALEFGSQPRCGNDGVEFVEERQTQIFSYQYGTFEAEQTLLEHAIEHGVMSYQAVLDWVDLGDQPVLVREATRTTLEMGGDEGASSNDQPFEKTAAELDFFTIDADCHLVAADEDELRDADTYGVLPPPTDNDDNDDNEGDEADDGDDDAADEVDGNDVSDEGDQDEDSGD